MAKVKVKGTALQMEVATVFTAIAQLVSLEGPEGENETTETRTIDQSGAGIPYDPTGYTEGGSVSGELLFDPVLASHKLFTAQLTTPAKNNWKIVHADVGATAWPFSSAGVKFGTTYDAADALKASFEIKLDGMVTYPA